VKRRSIIPPDFGTVYTLAQMQRLPADEVRQALRIAEGCRQLFLRGFDERAYQTLRACKETPAR